MRAILAMAWAVALSASASVVGAATFNIVDAGSSSGLAFGTISGPPAGGGVGNSVLVDVLDSNERDGYYGSAIQLAGTGTLTFDVLGWEAAWDNEFWFDGAKRFDASAGDAVYASSLDDPLYSFTTGLINGGSGTVLDFSFLSDTDGSRGSITNGEGNSPLNRPDFFASIVSDPDSVTGTAIYLFLDDGGAGPDSDYDDYVVRITVTPIPLPATGALLIAGLCGFAALRRYRN